ncbi:MAG: aminotransferase class V-fold PLP-dependent enzyme [Spirochaetes bacterium]|uniref:cysteine desulfurase n=1 Tax=Candidatus Aphodenecus pullistercoris TaxID=2840669 RepID=A0A9D9EBQ1_9SPIR|nr:aminotransferase class V-fold PLP-dependent enzyme [Candidatus Aphodenecus pullistercoris]
MSTIYLDNNATTRMADEVAALMRDNLALYGNASSMHSLGRDAYSGIDWAREMCASLISSDKDEILFTSGASESNNTVFNTARELIDAGSKRDRIVTTTIEHPSIIETVKYLKSLGYRIDECPVDREGRLRLDDFERLMGPDVLLVSIMTGNNETGTIQPVGEAARLAHACGALVHSDATQAIGKIPVSVKDLDVDYLSLSAHKFYGPKGVGVLYVRKDSPISPFVHGGHQEAGLRAGTYNNLGIIGLGEAARLARENLAQEHDALWAMRERLRKGIEERIPEVVINGCQEHCLPGTLNVSFPGAEGESILLYLDLEGIEVSTGSACATGSLEPSYVLLAGGLDVELAHGSIRFSLGRYNTMDEVDTVIEKLPPIIERVRAMSTRRK